MAKQLTVTQLTQIMAAGGIARYVMAHGRHQWVIGLRAGTGWEQIPCGIAVGVLARRAMLWMACGDEDRTNAGLNARGKKIWAGVPVGGHL